MRWRFDLDGAADPDEKAAERALRHAVIAR